jgi:phosphoribosyl 1,2-cyclic phosphodiesterase
LGLDDLKQIMSHSEEAMLYGDRSTIYYLHQSYSYIFRVDEQNVKSSGRIVPHIIEPLETFKIENIRIFPFHVQHGSGMSLGFVFNEKVLYLSDCSHIQAIFQFTHLDLLIIECNSPNLKISGHLNFDDVTSVVKKINPKLTVLVGMAHFIEYEHFNEVVKKTGLNIILGWDGMEIDSS